MKMITLSLRTVLLLLLWMATLTRTASPWQYTALSSEASSSTRPSLSRKGLSALACGGAGGSESGSVGLHVCCNTRTLILTVLRRCSFSSALSAKQHTVYTYLSLLSTERLSLFVKDKALTLSLTSWHLQFFNFQNKYKVENEHGYSTLIIQNK